MSALSGSQPITFTPRGDRYELVYGRDVWVGDWVRARLPNFLGWGGQYIAIGYQRSGTLRGGVVFTQHSHPNILMAAALDSPLTRRFLRAMFYYPFMQLGCERITVLIDDNNLKSMRLVEHVGFEREGCMRRARPGGDVVIYGLLRSNCEWV